MIKFWTVQNKYTLDKLVQDGVYYPDFKFKSKMVCEEVNLSYDIMRRIYQDKNEVDNVNGLVFGLTNYLKKEIVDYEQYKYMIRDSGSAGISCSDDDYYVLELEIDENKFDICSCHFYNFSDLIYYFDIEYEYTTDNERMLVMRNLFSDDSCLYLIQSHIHYIDKSMIKGIYKSYSYDFINKVDKYGKCEKLEYYKNKLIINN